MKKVYIVLDEPESCDDCPLFDDEYLQMACKGNGYGIGFPYPKDFKQEWCPLKPVPEKMAVEDRWFSEDYSRGWNACIDGIL